MFCMRLNSIIATKVQSMQEHNAQFRSLNRRSLEVLSPVSLEESIPQVNNVERTSFAFGQVQVNHAQKQVDESAL